MRIGFVDLLKGEEEQEISFLKQVIQEHPYNVTDYRSRLNPRSFSRLFENPTIKDSEILLEEKVLYGEIKLLESRKIRQEYLDKCLGWLDHVPARFGCVIQGIESIDTNASTDELKKQYSRDKKISYALIPTTVPTVLIAGSVNIFLVPIVAIGYGLYLNYLAGREGVIDVELQKRSADELVKQIGNCKVKVTNV